MKSQLRSERVVSRIKLDSGYFLVAHLIDVPDGITKRRLVTDLESPEGLRIGIAPELFSALLVAHEYEPHLLPA